MKLFATAVESTQPRLAEPAGGRMFQINVSNGGVPKLPRHQAVVTSLGLTEDHHRHPEFHGGPERAVCLYSLERILALQAEGHPIFPGSTGENLTLSGLDWDLVLPGVRLQVGETLLLEVTRFTTPCQTIIASFSDQNSNRIHAQKYPGWSRAYARVLQPGMVQIGNPVQIIESGSSQTG
jgi:MOSC domain-containing protein YiiM